MTGFYGCMGKSGLDRREKSPLSQFQNLIQGSLECFAPVEKGSQEGSHG